MPNRHNQLAVPRVQLRPPQRQQTERLAQRGIRGGEVHRACGQDGQAECASRILQALHVQERGGHGMASCSHSTQPQPQSTLARHTAPAHGTLALAEGSPASAPGKPSRMSSEASRHSASMERAASRQPAASASVLRWLSVRRNGSSRHRRHCWRSIIVLGPAGSSCGGCVQRKSCAVSILGALVLPCRCACRRDCPAAAGVKRPAGAPADYGGGRVEAQGAARGRPSVRACRCVQ